MVFHERIHRMTGPLTKDAARSVASPWRALAVITVAIFISSVDTTIVNVALPDMAHDLDAGLNELQWVIDAFLVALAGLLLVGSGLGDRFGRRRILLGGFALFGIGSLVAALAQTPELLIAARVIMGAALAGVLPTALALLAVLFEGEQRARAIAIWAAVSGVGFTLGPVIGGALVDVAGWRWVFLVNLPFVVLAVAAGARLLPESRRPEAPSLDVLGAALSVIALGGVVFALIEGQAHGWVRPPVVAALAAGVAAAVGFVIRERRIANPLFDVRVVARPAVTTGVVALMAIYGSCMGMLFLVPQYLQDVQARSALTSGILLAPLGIGMALTSSRATAWVARVGARMALTVGLSGLAISFTPLLLLTPSGSPLVVALSALFFGLALGLTIGPATVVVIEDLGANRAGDAGAVNQLGRQVGGAIGVALVGSLYGALSDDLTATASTHWGLALCATFLGLAALRASRPSSTEAPRR
jgi:EmrB/QacA subfamily drug resistance transporter